MVIYTLGHSTRSLDELVRVLEAHGIRRLVDIRTVPRSRTNPQFNRDVMPGSLAPHGIVYTHLAGLGGLRKARPDSPNDAWENASFRGYADYSIAPSSKVRARGARAARRGSSIASCSSRRGGRRRRCR